MLRIDTVIRNSILPQIKARLDQIGIFNYSVYKMDSGRSKPSFCVSRSQIEIICKDSQKDAILEAISDAGAQNGIIYVNKLTPVITLNQD